LLFAIAVATSSVKFSSRDSVSGGSGSGRFEWTASAPHNRPSTTIGQPTEELTPMSSRMNAALRPGRPVQSLTRAGSRASAMIVAGSPGSMGQLVRIGSGSSPPAAQLAIVVTVASSS
jgi:hypothetical protein